LSSPCTKRFTNHTIGRTAQQRREHEAHERREAVGVGGADDLRSDLGKHEDQERDRDGAECERPLALAEQAHGDEARERGRGRVDQVVAEQDDAEQAVGLREKRHGEPRAARAALRLMLQPIAVRGHHRRLGDRKEARRHEQDDQRQRERA
jgi:hypothetical protein